MPAAKTAKRAAAALPAPAEKRAKQDPLMAGIADAIGQAKDLPDSCRTMLLAAVPGCLGTPSEERHECQTALVSWIGEVVDGVRAGLQESLDEADAAEARAAEAKAGLDGKAADAKASLQERDEEVSAKGAALKDAREATVGAKAALAEALEGQKAGDARLVEAEEEKKGLEEALEQRIAQLKEVEGFQAQAAEAHLAVLMPIAKRLALDDSLVVALPAVAARPPSSRGAFDCMVLDQLEASLHGQVAKLASELDAGAPAAADRAASAAAAQDELKVAEDAERAAADALAAANGAQADAAVALREAEAAVDAFVSGRKAEVKAREAKAFALQNFGGYNAECFATLRDRKAVAGA